MRNLSELENNFIVSLKEFTELSTGDDFRRSDLFVAYHQLLHALSGESQETRSKTLQLIFLSLIEQLDRAPDGEISEVLYLYTFRDFLETYSEEPVIQKSIKDYIDSNALHKLPLRIALTRRQTAAR